MSKSGILIVLISLFCLKSASQNKADSLYLNFQPRFDKLPFHLNQNYTTTTDTLTVTTFRCYISNIQIEYADHSIFKEKNSYHLLDAENPSTLLFPIALKSEKLITQLVFNVGIDSLTNTSGAMSGDLDPVKGMYWAWQSGYINMKIEGKKVTGHEVSKHKNEFQFHIGGYLPPYSAMQKATFNCNKNSNEPLTVVIDLKAFFSQLNLAETKSVMIPGKSAMQLAAYSSKMFRLE